MFSQQSPCFKESSSNNAAKNFNSISNVSKSINLYPTAPHNDSKSMPRESGSPPNRSMGNMALNEMSQDQSQHQINGVSKIGGTSLLAKNSSKTAVGKNFMQSSRLNQDMSNDLMLTKSATNLSGFVDQSASDIATPLGNSGRKPYRD